MKLIISVNGEKREIVEGLTIGRLLDELDIRPARVAIELNCKIVSREAYDSAVLKDGDALEIVHFVGGG